MDWSSIGWNIVFVKYDILLIFDLLHELSVIWLLLNIDNKNTSEGILVHFASEFCVSTLTIRAAFTLEGFMWPLFVDRWIFKVFLQCNVVAFVRGDEKLQYAKE